MKGAFGNEGALRFLKRNLGSARVSRVGCGVLAATGFPPMEEEKFANPKRLRQHAGRVRYPTRPTALLFCQISGYRWPEFGFLTEERQNFFHERVGGDAVFLPQDWNCAVLDELIGPTNPHDWGVDHLRV